MRPSMLLGLCLAHVLPCQLNLKVESASRLYVRSSQCGAAGTTKYWPAGKDLGKWFSLTADYQPYSTTYSASFSTTLRPSGLDITQSATDFATKDTCGGAGPNDVILTVTNARAQTTRFTIESSTWGRPDPRMLWVDVHADGSFEYKASRSFPKWSTLVPVGPKPLKIRIRTHTTWTWHGGGVTTRFRLSRNPPCDVARYGQSCGKIRAEGPFPFGLDQVYLFQAIGHPNALGAMVIGTHKISVPLPGASGCRLLTDPALVHFYRTNGLGEAMLFLPIPQNSPSFANLQLLNAVDNNGRLDILAAQPAAILCR